MGKHSRRASCKERPQRPGRFASPLRDRERAPLLSALSAGSSQDAPRAAIRKEGAPDGNGCLCVRDAGRREIVDGRSCRPLPIGGQETPENIVANSASASLDDGKNPPRPTWRLSRGRSRSPQRWRQSSCPTRRKWRTEIARAKAIGQPGARPRVEARLASVVLRATGVLRSYLPADIQTSSQFRFVEVEIVLE
jgi:hypothetical protein